MMRACSWMKTWMWDPVESWGPNRHRRQCPGSSFDALHVRMPTNAVFFGPSTKKKGLLLTLRLDPLRGKLNQRHTHTPFSYPLFFAVRIILEETCAPSSVIIVLVHTLQGSLCLSATRVQILRCFFGIVGLVELFQFFVRGPDMLMGFALTSTSRRRVIVVSRRTLFET